MQLQADTRICNNLLIACFMQIVFTVYLADYLYADCISTVSVCTVSICSS